MNRRPWLLPVGIVVLANLFALGTVLRDRAGDPVATMVLTSSELGWWGNDDEDSGTLLRLSWLSSAIDSVGIDRIRALGFRCRDGQESCVGGWQQERAAYALVGTDSVRWIRDTLRAARRLDSLRALPKDVDTTGRHWAVTTAESELSGARTASRLVILDVALTREELVQRLAPGQFILPAELDAWYRGSPSDRFWQLQVSVRPSAFYVPTELARPFRARREEGITTSNASDQVLYDVMVATGNQGLLRITSVAWRSDTTLPSVPQGGDTASSFSEEP